MTRCGPAYSGRALASGLAEGEALLLDEPLSFWGGIDSETGEVIDQRHPQAGVVVRSRILVMPSGRGSSSSSSVLAESIRSGTAPAGIILREPDPIVALGSLVAAELYGRSHPVVVLDEIAYGSIRSGHRIRVEAREDAAAVRIVGTDQLRQG